MSSKCLVTATNYISSGNQYGVNVETKVMHSKCLEHYGTSND